MRDERKRPVADRATAAVLPAEAWGLHQGARGSDWAIRLLGADGGDWQEAAVQHHRPGEHRRMLALLREAIVDPGGRLKIVNRRDAMTAGGLLAVTLATSYQGWFEGEAVASTVERGTIDMGGVRSLRTIVGEYRRLDDTIGPEPLRPGLRHISTSSRVFAAEAAAIRSSESLAESCSHPAARWMRPRSAGSKPPDLPLPLANQLLDAARRLPSRPPRPVGRWPPGEPAAMTSGEVLAPHARPGGGPQGKQYPERRAGNP